MRTNKPHWNYSHQPPVPNEPKLIDEKLVYVEEVIETFGTYNDINLDELGILKNRWKEKHIGLDATFNVCIEDTGKNGEIEYELILKACFTRPRTELEIKTAKGENESRQQRYKGQLSLHKLQMVDYEVTRKEMAEETKQTELATYKKLKEKFGDTV